MAVGRWVVVTVAVAVAGYGVYRHPPMKTLMPGEAGVRINALSGESQQFGEGPVWLAPGVHELRRYSLRDRVWRDANSIRATSSSPFQTGEGLLIGVDLTIRYALDRAAIQSFASRLPDDIESAVVGPMLRGVAYKAFSGYTAKEIYSSKRAEIQEQIAQELGPRLKADGILLRGVDMGQVDLPADYRAGLERTLARELETEEMKHTLVLKDQQVRQSELEAQADLVRREKNAEASAREQIIAAKAQADTMVQIILLKHRQIEQRKLEAEAEKLTRVSAAETSAEARRLEAAGEADSRHKLAEADIFRAEGLARVSGDQMEREGLALSHHPLLVQKTMAEKLSDKISVIVIPPGTKGEIIDTALFGKVTGR